MNYIVNQFVNVDNRYLSYLFVSAKVHIFLE